MTNAENRHPHGFWFIFWGELAERASFYGMRTLLLLYMVDKLGFTDANSSTVVSSFVAACYILPIVGGYIADRWLGKFRTIIYFAIPYIAGHIILGTFNTEVGLFTALALLAGGSGTIKPNISTLMGLMYQKQGKSHLLTQAFSWFYMAINIGAASTQLTLPFIRDHYGYSVAFMAPTIMMAVSLGIFYLGKKHYPEEDVRAYQQTERTPEQRHEERAVLFRLSGLFLMVVFFWSIFDQSYSTWTLLARDYMNLETPFGRIAPDAIQGINPVLIVVMTPFFAWLWTRLDKRAGGRLASPRKMMIGFVLVTSCMALMAVAGYFAAQNKISVLWEVGAYILVTMGELCISVVGLQLAFEEAPAHMKSRITGVWLTTTFLGNLLAGLFARLYTQTTPFKYFGSMTIMMVLVTIVFYFIGRRFDHRKTEVTADSVTVKTH